MSNLDRVTGQNCSITITATNIDAGTNGLLSTITGYVDKFEAKYQPKFATYTPIGQTQEHDQALSGVWNVTMSGGDRDAMFMALSRDQDHRRINKQSLPSLTLSVVGYDPDDNSQAFDFTFSDGTLQDATLTIDGLDKDVQSGGTLKFRSIN